MQIEKDTELTELRESVNSLRDILNYLKKVELYIK
jgi:hypothetical protein